jgi:hypothetical protein
LSGQQLATTVQVNPPDVTTTLEARRSLKLPAFPANVPSTAPTAPVPPPGPMAIAPDAANDLPRTGNVATGSLRRFPLAAGRTTVAKKFPGIEILPGEAMPGEAAAPTHAAPIRARRVLLPAAPTEPTEPEIAEQKVFVPVGTPLTGEGSIIDRKAPVPTPGFTVAPTAREQTPPLGRLYAVLPDSPAMLASVLLAVGLLVLMWTIATHPPRPYNVLLFVNACGLCLAGALVYGLGARRARRARRPSMDGRHRS